MRNFLLFVVLSLLATGCGRGPNPGPSPTPAQPPATATPSETAQANREAPSVVTVDQDGNKLDLAEEYKSGTVLVYFYPKADTPGCTAQACSLRDSYETLTDKGVTVIGVSLDGAEDQKAFKAKYNLPFKLIPDTDKKVVDAFGVTHVAGAANREAFLIQGGQIVWHDASASTTEQAADVLAQLKDDKS